MDNNSAYFSYYGQLVHQQNMLSDSVRTSLYKSVVSKFAQQAFANRTVMDIGAGSGVLSFFAAQHGSRKVLAVEASQMSKKLQRFIDNSLASGKNQFIKSKDHIKIYGDTVEQLVENRGDDITAVDTIISEPIGVLLVHERMLESFLLARDKFLKPSGSIFPTTGTIHLAPFSDFPLWTETFNKAKWWSMQQDFHGIDYSSWASNAVEEAFRTSIVGPFNANQLLARYPSSFTIDFETAKITDLHHITIHLQWTAEFTGIIHGIAGWFDCGFHPRNLETQSIILSTHPADAQTHWQQIRFLFENPLAVNKGTAISGYFDMKVNDKRSYCIQSQIGIEGRQCSGKWDLHEQTFYYPATTSQPPLQDYQTAGSDVFGLY